jgi:hypothetical protein
MGECKLHNVDSFHQLVKFFKFCLQDSYALSFSNLAGAHIVVIAGPTQADVQSY